MRVITSDRRIISLSGGGWGPGELIQDQPGDTWRWRPVPAVDTTPALNADRWSQIGQPGTEPDLVIRVDVFLPWRGATSWRIEKRGRERLQAAVPGAALSQSMMTVARHRAGPARPGRSWPSGTAVGSPSGPRNNSARSPRRPSPAFTAEARLVVPNGYQYPVRAE
jgi:hypothetical protein